LRFFWNNGLVEIVMLLFRFLVAPIVVRSYRDSRLAIIVADTAR